MHPTLVRSSATTAVVLALTATSACGGGSDSPGPQAKESPSVVETPKTWPPKGSSGDSAVYPYLYGVSWSAPRAWRFKRSDLDDTALFIWSEPKKKNGARMSVTVQNSRSTVESWLKISGNLSGVRKTMDEKVSVPGYGEGRHLRFVLVKGGSTQDMLVVTSVDGVLLEMDVYLARGADTGLADDLIGSVKRGAQ